MNLHDVREPAPRLADLFDAAAPTHNFVEAETLAPFQRAWLDELVRGDYLHRYYVQTERPAAYWGEAAGAPIGGPTFETREVRMRTRERGEQARIARTLQRLEQQYYTLMANHVMPRDTRGLCFWITRTEYRELVMWLHDEELARHGFTRGRMEYRGYPLRIIVDEGERLW